MQSGTTCTEYNIWNLIHQLISFLFEFHIYSLIGDLVPFESYGVKIVGERYKWYCKVLYTKSNSFQFNLHFYQVFKLLQQQMYLIDVFDVLNYQHIKVFLLGVQMVPLDRVYFTEHVDISFVFF